MPRFDVQIGLRVWISKETNAKTREEAEARVKKQADRVLSEKGFCWVDGKVEVIGIYNMTLLNKVLPPNEF